MGTVHKKQSKAMETIAALLTVHNRREQTMACLQKLFTQSMPDNVKLDVFLVDDGCTDDTAQAVNERFPNVHVIPADGSLYWNRGMHKAWAVASQNRDYEYYLWLNDDTQLLDYAVEHLLRLCKEYGDEIIVVGATKSSMGDKLTYGGRAEKGIPPCDGKACEIERFNGNIVLVPRAVYNVLGNLDYYYTHSRGDFDYGLRAMKQGIKMYQCGKVLGVCDEHAYIDAWCNPEIPFAKRWQLMLMPNGMPPNEIFHYEKQISIWVASFHFMTVLLRCIFPKLWVKKCSSN